MSGSTFTAYGIPAAKQQPSDLHSLSVQASTGMQLTLPAEYSQSVTLAGYLGGQGINLSVPDLSGVSGWSNAWAPGSSENVSWSAVGSGSNLTSACSAGGRIVSGSQSGQI